MKIKLIIKSHIYLNASKITNEAFREIEEEFTYRNSTYDTNERMGYSILGIPKYLKSYKLIKDGKILRLSRGTLKRILSILKHYKYIVKIIDRTVFDTGVDVVYKPTVKLREDQLIAVNKAVNTNYGGLIKAPTSFGKTLCALSIIAKLGKQANVIVWSQKHQQQWFDEILKFKFLKASDIGGVGGIFKEPKAGKINILMQQSIATIAGRSTNNIKDFIDIPVTVCDEGQRFSAKTFSAVINKLNSRYKFAVSADFSRADKKEYLINDAFGSYAHIEHEKASDSKILAVINLITTKFDYPAYKYTRNRAKLISKMVEDFERNKIIVLRAIKKIKQGKLVLIMVERKDHAARLARMLANYEYRLLIGPTSKKTIENYKITENQKDILRGYKPAVVYNETVELAKTKAVQVIIGTSVTFVGLSIKTIDHAIICTPSGRDTKLFNQKVGRVERTYGNDEELLKLYGKKKMPSVDYLADMNIASLANVANEIKKNFPRKVRFLKS